MGSMTVLLMHEEKAKKPKYFGNEPNFGLISKPNVISSNYNKKSFNVRHSIPVYGNKSIEQKLSTISTLFSSWNAICFHFSLLYPYP